MPDAATEPRPVSAYGNDALGRHDATALAGLIARGEVSAREALEAAIGRLEAVDPALNAIACERLDAARGESRRLPGPGAASPFAGVPSLIKDNTDMAGLPTRHGSRAVPATPRRHTAAFAKQFLATGLLPLAKTRLPEFGLTATTEFVDDAPTRNPWHTGHSPGGSSGGSAALVAAGVVPIAHANDGGGSTRIPAACCGLVGLKPSRGRLVANDQSKRLPVDIVADGVVTRSVRDTAAFYAAAEAYYRNPALPLIGRVQGPGDEKLRIAYFSGLPNGERAHPECVAAVEESARLCERLGHHVELVASPLKQEMAEDFLLYYGMIAASLRHLGRLVVAPGFEGGRLEPLTRQLAAYFRRNIARFPGALHRLRRAPLVYEALLSRYHVLISPVLGHPPPPLGYLRPDLDFETASTRFQQYAAFTPAQNICGAPAVSLPLAMSRGGLPIGVQLAAGIGRERRLLGLAYALEEAAPWPRLAA